MIPTEKSLAYYVTLLRKDFTGYCSDRLQEMGLSQGLLYFIIYVGKHPDCSPKELAQALSLDTGHVTRSLVKLEQGGFIRQLSDPKDHRSHILGLLPRGEEAFRASYELFVSWDREIMQEMPEGERQQLFALLGKLVKTDGGAGCARNAAKPE